MQFVIKQVSSHTLCQEVQWKRKHDLCHGINPVTPCNDFVQMAMPTRLCGSSSLYTKIFRNAHEFTLNGEIVIHK